MNDFIRILQHWSRFREGNIWTPTWWVLEKEAWGRGSSKRDWHKLHLANNTWKELLHNNSGEINFPVCLFICFIQFLKCRIWSTWCYILDKVGSQLHLWEDKINMVGYVIILLVFWSKEKGLSNLYLITALELHFPINNVVEFCSHQEGHWRWSLACYWNSLRRRQLVDSILILTWALIPSVHFYLKLLINILTFSPGLCIMVWACAIYLCCLKSDTSSTRSRRTISQWIIFLLSEVESMKQFINWFELNWLAFIG